LYKNLTSFCDVVLDCDKWFTLRAVHKKVRIKSLNIHPSSPVRKMSELAQPSLSVRTHHKFRRIRSFFAPKSTDVRILRTPPPFSKNGPNWTKPLSLTAYVFYKQPLSTRVEVKIEACLYSSIWAQFQLDL